MASSLSYYYSDKDTGFEKKFVFDEWDRYKYIFEHGGERNPWEGIKDISTHFGKLGVSLLYPKDRNEFLLNIGNIYIFGRPLEMLLGSKIMIYTYISSILFTWLCTIPSVANRIRTETSINPYSKILPLSISLFFNFINVTRCYWTLRILSYAPFIFFLLFNWDEYEYRPIFLTAIFMKLFLNFRYNIL